MPDIGPMELIIVAVIALIIFGPGKMVDLGGSLGKGIREFRKASRDDGAEDAPAPPPPAATRFCTDCGGRNGRDAKYCTACGASLAAPAG